MNYCDGLVESTSGAQKKVQTTEAGNRLPKRDENRKGSNHLLLRKQTLYPLSYRRFFIYVSFQSFTIKEESVSRTDLYNQNDKDLLCQIQYAW
jgi:hypothetical protein